MTEEAPIVGQAENVLVDAGPHELPYARIIAAVTGAVIIGFMLVTFGVLRGEAGAGIDAATKGSIIQTWNNSFLLAVGFWIGSSLGGKVTRKKQ